MNKLILNVNLLDEFTKSFNLLQSAKVFSLASKACKNQDSLRLQNISQFYINYHAAFTVLSPTDKWINRTLYSDTPEFRKLFPIDREVFIEEDSRINELFKMYFYDEKMRIYIFMTFANYWIRHLDGFRVSIWTYRALQLLYESDLLSEKMIMIRNSLRNTVLSSIDFLPFENASEENVPPTIYEKVEYVNQFIVTQHGISIDDFMENFTPRFSSLVNFE